MVLLEYFSSTLICLHLQFRTINQIYTKEKQEKHNTIKTVSLLDISYVCAYVCNVLIHTSLDDKRGSRLVQL